MCRKNVIDMALLTKESAKIKEEKHVHKRCF
jgi:hypothetical protein